MATFSSVSTQHILKAIAEYDERGGEQFLDVYGFVPTPGYAIVQDGRTYDAKAVLGVAHRFATGRLATPDEFSSGMASAMVLLRKRGFEVIEPAVAARPAPVKATRTRAARTPATRSPATRTVEAPPAICPTCSMVLPATGICDDCG